MHRSFAQNLSLAGEPALSCAPHLKVSTPPDPNTPRLRTSMSSHSRLVPDDVLDDAHPLLKYSPITPGPQKEGDSTVSDGSKLMDMPEEIHQRILDMLMGELRPTSSSATDSNHALRNWNHAMRHPRGRRLANIALVTPAWRRLIQERLYRHIKVAGTNQGLQECYSWFFLHPQLGNYVRHIEFWVPVWEKRGESAHITESQSLTDRASHLTRNNFSFVTTGDGIQAMEPINSAYRLSSQKATLEELFSCVKVVFRSACALSIEGGHCKKPPMIQHFRRFPNSGSFTKLPNIQTLVMRGAWNITREDAHFRTIAAALPNVKEWHYSFTKPKTRGYQMMHSVLRQFPPTLTHLNICLEGFYSKKPMDASKVQILQREYHLCDAIGQIMPQLEALTLTGRACNHIFTHAIEAAKKTRKPRLKSLDLVVKNCCRNLEMWNDGIGIHNWSFITAFEKLVTAATKSLRYYPNLHFLRIRFVDLDTPCPLLNPYFQLVNNEAAGIWNENIDVSLAEARPGTTYAEDPHAEGLDARYLGSKNPYQTYPAQRPKIIKVANYTPFVEGPFF